MIKNNFFKFTLAACAMLGFVGCSKDEPNPTPEQLKGDIAVSFNMVNPDGKSGTVHVKLLDGIEAKHVDNANAFYGGFSSGMFGHKNSIYVFPAYMGGDKPELSKYNRNNGKLEPAGKLPLPPQASAACMEILNENKAYVSLQALGKLLVFNPTTMQQIGEIDLNGCIPDLKDENGTIVKNPSPGAMIIRDGVLFVALDAMVGEYWLPSEKRPYSDMAVIDTKTDKLEKVITEKSSGIAFPSRPIDRKTIFMDEQGDIYIACMGGFGYKPIDAGFLRIKKGTTEFDPSYHWVISKQHLEGFSVSPKYIPACRYIGNGKVCAYVFVKESNQSIGHIDLACVPVMMDLKSKTMKRINIPVSSGYSVAIEKYKDKVLFGNMNEKDKGIYIYDPKTNTASDKAVITTEGQAWQMHYFGE